MKDSAVIGRISEFERCTIYWSGSTGAFEVHGSIRDKYKAIQGPSGVLGFPTSDESDVPGASGARYNTFQQGSIVWFGSAAETYVCMAFDIILGRVDTEESEGFLRGENDVYMHARIEDNGHVIRAERIPSSGDSDGDNIFTVNKTFNVGIVPNSPSRVIRFTLDIWDSDWPDGDDHLGFFDYTLNMANAWGFRGNPSGLFNSGSFDNINSITWSVAPRVNEALLTESQRWWGVQNRGTDPLTYNQYASAFSDVDSDTEWWDLTDWLAKLFYELVVESLAKSGNCFGMSLESIYSKKHRSIMRLPLDRFTEWEPVRNEFNIKHQYQVGAPAIWWFVGEFLSGQTHDPVDVFRRTRSAYFSGCDPVLCISQNYDFSGKPHCILPIGWNDSVKPWQMLIHDPNWPSLSVGDPGPRILTVDPDANTYFYDGGSDSKYSGGEWSGGRMHYMPFDLLNERPRTPIFDAIMLLLSGVILLVGSDSETTSLTDEHGVDLDAFGADSISRLQAGKSLTNKFVSMKGFDQNRDSQDIDYRIRECAKEPPRGQRPDDPKEPRRPRPHGVLPSELYMRSETKQYSREAPPNKRSGDDWKRVTLKEYLCQLAPADIRTKFAKNPQYVAKNQGRLLHYLSDPFMKEILSAAIANRPPITSNPYPSVSKNFIHTTRGLRRGRLQYGVKQGFSEFMLIGETATAEPHRIEVKDLGTHTNTVTIKGNRDKSFNLEIHNKLGAGKDQLRISISGIPLTAGGELQLNIKPGLGGVELLSAGQEIRATVKFEYQKDGGEIRSTFPVKEMGGVRVVPSTFISGNQLKVNRINNLFGESLSSTLILPM